MDEARRSGSASSTAKQAEKICDSCDADHTAVAAISVRDFPMTRIGEVPMRANMDVVISLGYIVFALICLVAEVFYFLQLPISLVAAMSC